MCAGPPGPSKKAVDLPMMGRFILLSSEKKEKRTIVEQDPSAGASACCGGHGAQKHHHQHGGAPEAGLAKDPVCGMSVDPATARHQAHHNGSIYYFCSAGCRAKFIAAPERYLSPQ